MESSLDTPGLIQLMQQTAESSTDWAETVEFCEAHDHPREAMTSVQMGLQAHPDHPSLQPLLLRCYQRDGWDEEALALAQTQLRQRPDDMGRLDTLLQCAAALGQSREAALQAEIAQVLAHPALHIDNKKCSDISPAILWLLRDDQWQQALALLDQPQVFCTARSRRKLALHLPNVQYPRAVNLLNTVLALAMQSASSPYAEELQLVRQILARLPAEQTAAWLSDLRQRYLRKANFIKGLEVLAG